MRQVPPPSVRGSSHRGNSSSRANSTCIRSNLQGLIDDLSSLGTTLVLDMSQLSFMDTAGIHCLLNVHSSTGEPVVVRNPSPAARRMLQLCDGSLGHEAWVVEQN